MSRITSAQAFLRFAFLGVYGLLAACDGREHEFGHGYCATYCAMNLRSIEGAKAQWASDNNKTTNDVPTDSDLLGCTRYIREKPQCPKSGVHVIGRVGDKPRCSVRGHTSCYGNSR